MKILIATGASGGHIFPALSVAEELRFAGHDILFVGAFRQWKDMILDRKFVVEELPVRTPAVKSLKGTLVSFGCMLKSFTAAGRIIRRYRPQRVIGFGGYASFPTVLAGCILNVFTAVHEQNVVPGLANRMLALCVRRVFISFPQSRKFFPGKKTVVTGYPLRAFEQGLDKEACRKIFDIDPHAVTLAVCGGSQGSRALNHAMISAAELLKQKLNIQILHVSGDHDRQIVAMAYDRLGIPARVFSFFPEMEKIYQAADIVLSRAGAGAVHEIARFNVPAVIVPYPFAGAHQKQNALAFLKTGRGIMLEEKYLKAGRLYREMASLLSNLQQERCEADQQEFFSVNAARQTAEAVVEGAK